MTSQVAITLLKSLEQSLDSYCELNEEGKTAFRMAIESLELFGNSEHLPSAQPETNCSEFPNNSDTISRQAAIDAMANTLWHYPNECYRNLSEYEFAKGLAELGLKSVPSAQPELEKYEYHYDHTDCIWYRPEARNRCPVTCSQYRDGWNDAMNYIFRDGKGYMPYRRDKQYGE